MTHDQTPDTHPAIKEASSVIGSVAADMQAAVTKKIDETITEVRSQAHDAKDNVAGEVNDVAMALRHASEELRGGSVQERILGQVASSIADASDALRDRDLGEILQAASKVARDNPALFLGGAALLGFAASRYAKASAGHGTTPRTQPASERNAQINEFVNEGNPNTQAIGAAP